MKNQHDETAVTTVKRKKTLFAALLLTGIVSVESAQAINLPSGAELTITSGVVDSNSGFVTSGSYFGMDQSIYFSIQAGEKTPITSRGNIRIGSTSIATGSHGGSINGSESPAFSIWEFFGNTGMDYINPAPNDSGNGFINFNGWTVTWNGIAAIPMNARSWQPTNCSFLGCTGLTFTDGVAQLVGWDGISGHAYTLHYTATVPNGDPSGFGNVKYYLHLVGTVMLPAFTLTNDSAVTTTGTPVTINVTSNDPAAGSTMYTIDASSVTIASNASHGNAVANSNNTVTYTPSGGYTGPDSFTYKATGNNGIASDPATVTINVQASLPPTANGDTAATNGTTPVLIDVTNNDTAGSAAINKGSVIITTPASHGSTSVNGTTGVVTYTAYAAFSGNDTFQYTVSDATPQTSTPASVTVTVRATVPSSGTGTLSPGTTAVANSSATGGGLTSTMVGSDTALAQQCVGGCFDFQVTGLSAGASVKVVLPLSAPIPTSAVYRKRVSGVWQDFSNAGGNALASAPAVSPGVCPQSGSSAYSNGLTAGLECIQLTIVDGGPSDGDSAVNGTVLDPGGVGIKGAIIDTRTSSTSGCSLSTGRISLAERGDWWLMFGFVAWLGVIAHRRHQRV